MPNDYDRTAPWILSFGDKDDEPVIDRCEICATALEDGEIQFCNAHEPQWFVCDECDGHGHDGPCWEHGVGNCNCPVECFVCHGEGRLLLDAITGQEREMKEWTR